MSEARVFVLPLDSNAVENLVLRFWLDYTVDYAHDPVYSFFALLVFLLHLCLFDFSVDARLRLTYRIFAFFLLLNSRGRSCSLCIFA